MKDLLSSHQGEVTLGHIYDLFWGYYASMEEIHLPPHFCKASEKFNIIMEFTVMTTIIHFEAFTIEEIVMNIIPSG